MTSGGDRPPIFDEATRSFQSWKNEVRVWRMGTSIGKKKQAPRVVQALTGKVKDHCTRLSEEVLTADDGFEQLMAVIEKFYVKDTHQQLFISLDRLENFKRSPTMAIEDYLREYDRLNEDVAEILTKNPYEDGVLAYKLMKQCNLSVEQQQLVRATIPKLGYEEMKTSIRKIFGDKVIMGEDNDRIKIKEEIYVQQEDTSYGNRTYDIEERAKELRALTERTLKERLCETRAHDKGPYDNRAYDKVPYDNRAYEERPWTAEELAEDHRKDEHLHDIMYNRGQGSNFYARNYHNNKRPIKDEKYGAAPRRYESSNKPCGEIKTLHQDTNLEMKVEGMNQLNQD